MLITIVFWFCLTLVVWVYLAYPATIWLLKPFRKRHAIGDALPGVTLVISAYNEAEVIGAKLENSLALEYPSDKLEIMVISDASTDGTDKIVSAYRDRGVVLCRQEARRGKSAALTQFVPKARGEAVVFSDANSMYEPDAIRKLVRHFADPRVGFVVGHQRYVQDRSEVSASESLYWRYETWLKIQESRIGSPVCGDGAIYAIRAGLFEPLREDDLSDFTLPLKIVARGYRGVFDEEAVCYERTAPSFAGEFRRKARIANRGLGAVLRVPQAMNPLRVGLFAYQLLFHKALRWLAPFFLTGLLAATAHLALWRDGLHAEFLALQLAFYALALLYAVPGLKRLHPVYLAFYFCMVNTAAAWGAIQLVVGRRIAVWAPERGPSEEAVRFAEAGTPRAG